MGGITGSTTLLTTIVSLDPIHCYVDTDERSYLKYTRLAQSGERPSSRDVQNPVWVGLADEEGFPHEGYMDFVDNQIDKGTGTMVGRAIVPNPDLILTPGLFARLQLPGSGRYQAILLPDAAILFDQAVSYVWVVDQKNRVNYRPIVLGRIFEGQRIVNSGLGPADRVIVAGVQGVRPGMEVRPEEIPVGGGTPDSAGAGKDSAAPAGRPAEGKGGEGRQE